MHGLAAYADGRPQHALVRGGGAVGRLLAHDDEIAGWQMPVVGQPLCA